MINTKKIKENFPFLTNKIDFRIKNDTKRTFLDNTASTQASLQAINALLEAIPQYANIHRGEYEASQLTTESFEKTYNIAANLINASSWQEIILGRNTTEMINLVMRTIEYEIRDGDNIVTTRLEHNSNYVPWYGLQKNLAKIGKNIQIRIADFDKDNGELKISQLEKLIDRKTKLVTVTGASNFLGSKPNMTKIGALAHSSAYKHNNGIQGSYFLIDGAQLVPGAPVDVQDIDCDFLAWSFHKMSLPFGVGGLYARKNILDSSEPFLFGGDMIMDVKEGMVEYKELPWKYTAGTPNILGTIATGAGISALVNMALDNIGIEKIPEKVYSEILMNTPRGDFQHKYTVAKEHEKAWIEYTDKNPEILSTLRNEDDRLMAAQSLIKKAMSNIQSHEERLTGYALEKLSDIPKIRVYGPTYPQQRAGLIAFDIKGMNPQVAAFELNKLGIELRNGNHCASLAHQYLGLEGTVRMSFYIYNDKDDVDKGISAIKKIVGGMK